MVDPAPRDDAVECFFTPRSVAIVGASADPRKWGWMAAEQALRNRDRRDVHLVNSRGGEILGQRCHSSVASLPDGLDLAVVTLPPAAFEPTIDQLVAKGTRAIVAITAGFGESGDAGRATETRIVERVRAAGTALVGPNCMGVFDGHAPFRCMPWAEISAGPVGFVSQSGGLIMDLSLRLAECGLGVSRAVSIGNQADVGIAEFVRNLGLHEPTRAIAIYGESFIGGREVFREIECVVAAGKPVVVMSPDATVAAHRAARSHTASLATQRRLIAAAARDAGALYVDNLREMTEVLQGLVTRQRGRGRRCFVLTDTGGPGVLLAGEIECNGLSMPMPSATLKATIEATLTPRAMVGNPIDLVDNLNVEPAVTVLQTLVDSDEVDAVLMNLHAFVHDTQEIEAEMGRRLATVARASGKPVVVSCRSLDIAGARALVAHGIPVFRDGDAAARQLAVMCADRIAPRGVPTTLEPLAPARPVQDTGYLAARALFTDAGIDLAECVPCTDLDEARKAALRIGYPVVLKAVEIERKSDRGGVALALADANELALAWARMSTQLGHTALAVEPMVHLRDGVELIVGVRRDPVMGSVLAIGLGGVLAEVDDDNVLLLAPVTPDDVHAALRRLRSAQRLLGARGRPPLALHAIARCAIALCDVAARHPELDVLEINPLLVDAERAIALDARIVASHAGAQT